MGLLPVDDVAESSASDTVETAPDAAAMVSADGRQLLQQQRGCVGLGNCDHPNFGYYKYVLYIYFNYIYPYIYKLYNI